MQGTKSAEYISEKGLATKVATLYDSMADYNSGVHDAFVAACADYGLEVVADEADFVPCIGSVKHIRNSLSQAVMLSTAVADGVKRNVLSAASAPTAIQAPEVTVPQSICIPLSRRSL